MHSTKTDHLQGHTSQHHDSISYWGEKKLLKYFLYEMSTPHNNVQFIAADFGILIEQQVCL